MSKRNRRVGRRRALGAAAAVVLVGAVSCSSSGSPTSTGTSGATAAQLKTFKVGVLTDLTGPAAANDASSVDGVKAGTFYAARNGYKIEYVVADTGTNPTAVIPAAQKLITQDHVGAIIATSALTYAAAPYLTARGIPVVGMDSDGPEWLTAKNMFSIVGAYNTTKVTDVFGDMLKLQGSSTLGSVGYGISPTSAGEAKGFAASAEAAGLKVGYLNAQFPFGGTNVGPVALAMKSAGVDGIMMATESNTSLALITALRNQGVDLKAALLPAGYGDDLLKAGATTIQQAQGVQFVMFAEPFAMQTDATKQMAKDLTSAGFTTAQASLGQYMGYLSMGLLVAGLKGAGDSPTNASLISSLANFHQWNGMGLFGSKVIDVNNRTDYVAGIDNCMWLTKLEGRTFTVIKGGEPICGKVVPGKTVSES
jgi:ABC-type branched-subunit amino acid transport system substrate-binding protein